VTNVVETIVVVTNAKLGWVDGRQKNSTNDGQTKVVVTNVGCLTDRTCIPLVISFFLYTFDRMYIGFGVSI
jgi:hypothetical protein